MKSIRSILIVALCSVSFLALSTANASVRTGNSEIHKKKHSKHKKHHHKKHQM